MNLYLSHGMVALLVVVLLLLQSCEVVVLQGPGDTLTLSNAEAAEAGYFGSIQQLYRLLSGLMQLAESGEYCEAGWGGGPAKIPRECLKGFDVVPSNMLLVWDTFFAAPWR